MKKLFLLLNVFTISIIIAQPPSHVPTDGLQAWYPFTGNANDLSGNNLNGTVLGANLTTDRFNFQNAAYSFAANQEIYIPNTENLNTYPLTISLWYNASSLEDGMASNIFSKYVPTAWNGFQILLSESTITRLPNFRTMESSVQIFNQKFGEIWSCMHSERRTFT